MNREAAEAAAAWWAEQIRSTTAETDGLHPGLSRDQAMAALGGIGLRAMQLEAAPPVTDEMAAAFATELARRIADGPDGQQRVFVDYAPVQVLRDAAEAAGVHTAHFPQKTRMTIHSDHVIAKAGYSEPWRLVWSALGWEHPACGVQEWPGGADDPVGPECARPRWHDGRHDWERP